MAEQEDSTLLVEEMLREATAAEEPGNIKKGQILAEGMKEIPLGVQELKSAGYAYIYDTLTGEPSKINRNMLKEKLKQKRVDGSFIFSVRQTVKPVRGTLKCLLHPDGENRAHYDALGLPVCKKSNLMSIFQVERHMQKRHPQEWATIKEEKDRKEKETDRAFQMAVIQSVGGKLPAGIEKPQEKSEKTDSGDIAGANEPELYVSDKDKRKKKDK